MAQYEEEGLLPPQRWLFLNNIMSWSILFFLKHSSLPTLTIIYVLKNDMLFNLFIVTFHVAKHLHDKFLLL